MENSFLIIFWSVVSIHLLAVMSPGPDFFMLVRNAITYSRRTGYWTAVGFGLGIGVHVMYSILGLGLIISKSPTIYMIIQYLGAAYLVYIGWMSLTSKGNHFDVDEKKEKTDISAWKGIRIGFLTNVLNPKATLFFLSLFTLVIGPDQPWEVTGILGLVMMINTTLWFCLLAYLITHSKVLPVFEKYQQYFNIAFGIILIGLAVKITFFN